MLTDLNPEQLHSLFTPDLQSKIRHWAVFEHLASTHRYLTEAKELPVGSVCLCDHQSQGQGRQGRSWVSPPKAGIYLSYSAQLHSTYPYQTLALVAALSLAQTLRAWKVPCGIKWPNDIWVQGKKLAGVLVEAMPGKRLVLSCGLNVQLPALPAGAIDLASIWHNPQALQQRPSLIVHILAGWIQALEHFDAEGFAPFYALWPNFDLLAQKSIVLHHGQEAQYGIAQGISLEGALRVSIDNQEKYFTGTEVSVRPLAE